MSRTRCQGLKAPRHGHAMPSKALDCLISAKWCIEQVLTKVIMMPIKIRYVLSGAWKNRKGDSGHVAWQFLAAHRFLHHITQQFSNFSGTLPSGFQTFRLHRPSAPRKPGYIQHTFRHFQASSSHFAKSKQWLIFRGSLAGVMPPCGLFLKDWLWASFCYEQAMLAIVLRTPESTLEKRKTVKKVRKT